MRQLLIGMAVPLVVLASSARAESVDAGACNPRLLPPSGSRIAASFPAVYLSDATDGTLTRTDDGTVASAHVVEAWYGTHYLVLDAPLSEGEWELVTDDPRPAYCPALGAHTFEVGPPVADDWLGTLSLSRFVVHELPTGRQPVLLLQITLPPGHEALVDLGPGGPRLDATVDGVAAGRAPDELSLAVAGYLQVPIECPAGEERTLAIAVQARIGDEILEGFDASTTVTVRCDDAAPWPPDAGLVGSDVDGGPGGGAPSASCSASASRSSSFAWLAIVSSLALVARRRR